jgi:hypothetical protein
LVEHHLAKVDVESSSLFSRSISSHRKPPITVGGFLVYIQLLPAGAASNDRFDSLGFLVGFFVQEQCPPFVGGRR